MSKSISVSYSVLLAVVLLAVSAWFNSVGFLASDDASYAATAINWNENFPFIGGSHWSLRQTLVLPLSAVFAVFGPSEIGLILVTTVYFVMLMVLCYWWLNKHVPGNAKLWFLLVAAVAPGFMFLAGTSNVDVVETFYFMASLMLFYHARGNEKQTQILFVSGLMVGLAFLSRATAVSLIVNYGLFFLMGAYHSRKAYLALGAGAALVFGADWLFYLIQTGDPLYRLNVLLFSHVGIDNPSIVHVAEGTGNLAVGTRWEPIMMLLINNEFGFVFYAAVAAWFWARRKRISFEGQDFVVLLFWGSVIHFVVVGYLMGLRPLPRYFSFLFMPALFALSMVFASSFASKEQQLRRIAAIAFAVLASTGFLLMDLGNKEPRYAEEVLLKAYRDYPGQTVYADSDVCRRAGEFLKIGYQLDDARPECVDRSAAQYLVLREQEYSDLKAEDTEQGMYTVRQTIPTGHTVVGSVIRFIGLDQLLPIPKRLIFANQPVYIIEVSSVGAAGQNGESS